MIALSDQCDCDDETKLWYSNTTSSSRWLPLGRSIMSTLEHLEPLQAGHVGHAWDERSEPCHIPVWGKGMCTVLSGRINVNAGNGWETRHFCSAVRMIDDQLIPRLTASSERGVSPGRRCLTIEPGEWGVPSYPPLELPVTVRPTLAGGGCSPEEERDEREGRRERGGEI